MVMHELLAGGRRQRWRLRRHRKGGGHTPLALNPSNPLITPASDTTGRMADLAIPQNGRDRLDLLRITSPAASVSPQRPTLPQARADPRPADPKPINVT